MTAFGVLTVQSTLSVVAFALLAGWYVTPRLATLPRAAALAPLLWVHVFRYAPLTLFAPGQVDPRIPSDVAAVVAYGDFVAAVVALLALCALRLHPRAGTAAVWCFSAVSVADMVVGTAKAVGAEMYRFYLGWNWYIATFYVPLLIVTQAMLIRELLRHRHAPLLPT